jgi:hypothetical protein
MVLYREKEREFGREREKWKKERKKERKKDCLFILFTLDKMAEKER